MENQYPFKWLDQMVEFRLDPLSTGFVTPGTAEQQKIKDALPAVLEDIFSSLNMAAFCHFSKKDAAPVINAFREAVSWLELRARENLAITTDKILFDTISYLLEGMGQLQTRIGKRYRSGTADHRSSQHQAPGPPETYKVMLRLSVDQFAIILKAADDAHILASRSLSMVFRSIIPYVSTARTENISWKSARSSTYKMEENDKSAAIEALEELIRRIHAY